MLEFILGVVVGTMALWLFTVWTVRRYLSRIQQAVDLRTQQDLIIQARVEQIGNEFYIYDMYKDQFLVQGRTMKELVDNLELTKPGTVVGVVDGDQQAIQNLKATA